MRIVAGTAANMGIKIEGWDMEESKKEWAEKKAAKLKGAPAAEAAPVEA